MTKREVLIGLLAIVGAHALFRLAAAQGLVSAGSNGSIKLKGA